MDERGGKPPISVEVGLKAGLEVKAEIPQKSVARLVDSLTDIIRPFTESRGLRADQIRLQREDILIEIARKARLRAEVEGIDINPVSMKLLVPFLEKASTEDTDAEMHDRWAALLLSASQEFHARHLTFLDILSRLSSEEAKILERVGFSYKAFPETSYPDGHMEQNWALVHSRIGSLFCPDSEYETARTIWEEFMNIDLIYGKVMHACIKYQNGGSAYFYSEFGSPGMPGFRSIEILQRERLVEVERLKNLSVEAAFFNLTHLGISFVRDCAPDARRMAARRSSRYDSQ
jgi:hypothetical protein